MKRRINKIDLAVIAVALLLQVVGYYTESPVWALGCGVLIGWAAPFVADKIKERR